jgi:Skp1 family, tetramerisation domain
MTKVQTNDGRVHEIPQGLMDECSTLKIVCEMTDCTDETWVPLPNVDSAILQTVVRFFESESLPAFTDLYPLLEAADYLGYEKLLDKGCESYAESLKGRAPEEIRRLCGLEEPTA